MSLSKKQHEGFARFFEKPTRESLRELLKENIGETDYLDFKREWIPKIKLAKHVLALSNSGGGALIFGVEEKDDGTLEPIGIPEFSDKAEISNCINKHVPSEVEYVVLDFPYKESEYPAIKGKKFQVMLVEYKPRFLPILSLKEGLKDGEVIKDNVVYVRRGTSTEVANHEELQKIINERIETGYSSKHVLELSDHLEQLKTLYRAKGTRLFVGFSQALSFNYEFGDFLSFVDDLIERKKRRIEEVLDLIK